LNSVQIMIQTIEQVRDGNGDAFAEIVECYQSAIVRYLYRMTGDYETAKDLAQDTFVSAYKNIPKSDTELSFKAWLYRIATNNALQHIRRKKVISFITFSSLPENDDRLSVSPENEMENLHIKQTLAQIPYDQRICLVLHFVEGFKLREIAEILDISKDAVSKRIQRGSKKFQSLY